MTVIKPGGHLLRIYQQYFMVCCGAKLILKELKEQNFELTFAS